MVELHTVTFAREGPGREEFLLIHGYGATSFSWRRWAPQLARRGRVTLVDLKGFGGSPAPDDRAYGPVDHAELVADLIERQDLRDVTIVGHSLGGGIALLAALILLCKKERRVGRLILLASAAYPQKLPPFVRLGQWPRLGSALLRVVGARLLVSGVLRSVVHDPRTVTGEWVEGYAKPLSAPSARRALIETATQLVPPDLEALNRRYREIDVPTLILWGRQDRVVPLFVGQRLSRELPRARLTVLEACGHLPQEERPRASLEVVEAFLDGSAPSSF